MCDEFTRESVGGRLGRSITADDVVTVLDQLRLERGAPEYVRCRQRTRVQRRRHPGLVPLLRHRHQLH
jgi:hypothetical protein